MAPKADPNAVTIVYVRQYGAEAAPASVLAPKIALSVRRFKFWLLRVLN